jgi:hypothetical protein
VANPHTSKLLEQEKLTTPHPRGTEPQLWRPITTTHTSPLALADGSTVPDRNLVAASIGHVKASRRRESWTIKPGGGHDDHRWSFKYRQTPDDVVLIGRFDSGKAARVRRTLHCAVEDPWAEGLVGIR